MPFLDPGLVATRFLHRFRPSGRISEERDFSRLAQLEILLHWARWRYQRIHLFRAAMLAYIEPLLRIAAPRVELDLDELESTTRRSLAELARLRGDALELARFSREAAYFEGVERAWLPRMRRIFVASELEKQRVQARYPSLPVHVLPNLPRSIPERPLPFMAGSRDLLFVGNMDYYPNWDAVEWLRLDVLPRLRARAAGWRLVVAGSGTRRPPPGHGLVDMGPVKDLEPLYAAAVAALVPIRAGGGTRIKALEAFGFARPVVGTSLGLEGLDCREAIVADRGEEFAERCAALLEDPGKAEESGRCAFEWLSSMASRVDYARALAPG